MMGIREPIIAEYPSPALEEIFGDLHPESNQTSTTCPEVVEGERVEVGATATEEVIINRGHEGGAQVEQAHKQVPPPPPALTVYNK